MNKNKNAEKYVSGPGLKQRAKDKFGAEMSTHEIFDKAKTGDKVALQILEDYKIFLIEILLYFEMKIVLKPNFSASSIRCSTR